MGIEIVLSGHTPRFDIVPNLPMSVAQKRVTMQSKGVGWVGVVLMQNCNISPIVKW